MDRRMFVSTAAGALIVKAFPANAQPAAKVPRIGVLHPGTPTYAPQFVEAFNQGLRAHGYVEGKNIVVERRFGDAKPERMAEMAAELVRLKVDVIVTATDAAIAAVKRETQTIPIVMANSTDPVGTGFVVSLAHPGGNVTGLTGISPELSAKRVELLKEAVPQLSRVAVMWDPEARGAVFEYKETEGAVRRLRLQLQSVETSRSDDIDRAFSAINTGRAEALIVGGSAFSSRTEVRLRAWRRSIGCHPCIEQESRWTPAVSWAMGRASPSCGVAPPRMWTRSSRGPNRVNYRSSSRRSSSWSST